MEMKIKNGILLQDEFLAYFQRLLQRQMPAKLCLELNTALDEIVSQIEILKKTRLDIAKQYGTKDNAGNLVSDERGDVIFPDQATKTKCLAEISNIYNENFVIELSGPVKVYDDEPMTPNELRYLGDLVQVIERQKEIVS